MSDGEHGNGYAGGSAAVAPPAPPPAGDQALTQPPSLPAPTRRATADERPTGQPAPAAPARARELRHGCYLLRLSPVQAAEGFDAVHYDGTLRVERAGSNTVASGDLYVHVPPLWPVEPAGIPSETRPLPPGVPRQLSREPNPGGGIPVFRRADYRYYVRVTEIVESLAAGGRFTLGFSLHRYDHGSAGWSGPQQDLSAEMSWTPAPSGYPSGDDYLTGTVVDATGATFGTLTMGWVSSHLRRAVVEIDRVAGGELPLHNGAGIDWQAVFDAVGWEVTIDQSDSDVAEPSGESWTTAEMHAAMLQRRDASDLDGEWRYHIICVRLLDDTERGIMYDAAATDSNNVPREGAGIASDWRIPDTAEWGRVRGMRFGDAPEPYYRTAVHELGHALGLYHNLVDFGFMNATNVIAAGVVPPQEFPDNVRWAFAPDDEKRLRHMPDPWVRPGGIAFGAAYATAPLSPDDSVVPGEGLELRVEPVHETVPFGAPVRVGITLRNVSGQPLPVPASLSMTAGFVRGRVLDSSGAARTFSPLIRCIEAEDLTILEPGASLVHGLTLLRGGQGALFPSPGTYTIEVVVHWDLGGLAVQVTGAASVLVRAAVDVEHAATALHLISTPDTLLTLAFGGDHLEAGVDAIRRALENDTLRPHYEFVEARRIGTRFGGRPADPAAATRLISRDTVLNGAEVKRAAELVLAAREQNGAAPGQALADDAEAPGAGIADVLREKAATLPTAAATDELLRRL